MKISIDFDGVLSTELMQRHAIDLILNGNDVWVTTKRYGVITNDWENNNDLFFVTDALNIPRSKIQFTYRKPKYLFLTGFDLHIDDDNKEIEMIKSSGIICRTILFCMQPDLQIN